MQEYIKKYFWALPVVVVIVCSSLSARAVNHYVEGGCIGDRAEAPKVEAPRNVVAATATSSRSKLGDPMVKRNMFCSECVPPEPEVDGPVAEGDTVPLTSLPLVLVATNIAGNEAFSFATIRNESTEKQGAYWIADTIPEAGKIEKIGGKNVIFRATNGNRLERIALLEAPAPRVAKKAPEKAPTTGAGKNDLMAEVEAGVKKVNDTTFEVDRALVDKVLANPMAVARGARVVPSIKDGKNNGFKLYAIRPSSAYAKLGMRNGDTIHAVNGFDLTTADKALEVYQKVKESSNLSVTVTRRGKPVTLTYTIR
jgi:general secretion pathway protein C